MEEKVKTMATTMEMKKGLDDLEIVLRKIEALKEQRELFLHIAKVFDSQRRTVKKLKKEIARNAGEIAALKVRVKNLSVQLRTRKKIGRENTKVGTVLV